MIFNIKSKKQNLVTRTGKQRLLLRWEKKKGVNNIDTLILLPKLREQLIALPTCKPINVYYK